MGTASAARYAGTRTPSLSWSGTSCPPVSAGDAAAARRPQCLTVYHLPAHTPELNPVERMQYRPGLIDGFLARSGFTHTFVTSALEDL